VCASSKVLIEYSKQSIPFRSYDISLLQLSLIYPSPEVVRHLGVCASTPSNPKSFKERAEEVFANDSVRCRVIPAASLICSQLNHTSLDPTP
jgi:hypothetical protein